MLAKIFSEFLLNGVADWVALVIIISFIVSLHLNY